MSAVTFVLRRRGATRKVRVDALGEAFDLLEDELRAVMVTERRGVEQAFVRSIEPEAQVVARGEVRGGRGRRGGVDVRGDGSAAAFTGSWRKEPVVPQPGEDAFGALRRVLA